MEVRYQMDRGCAFIAGTVFSCGLLLVVLWLQKSGMPAYLTDTEMILHNGQRIAWDQFRRVQATDVHYGRAYIGTRYVLTHSRGKVAFGSDKIANIQEVLRFMESRLPQDIQKG